MSTTQQQKLYRVEHARGHANYETVVEEVEVTASSAAEALRLCKRHDWPIEVVSDDLAIASNPETAGNRRYQDSWIAELVQPLDDDA